MCLCVCPWVVSSSYETDPLRLKNHVANAFTSNIPTIPVLGVVCVTGICTHPSGGSISLPQSGTGSVIRSCTFYRHGDGAAPQSATGLSGRCFYVSVQRLPCDYSAAGSGADSYSHSASRDPVRAWHQHGLSQLPPSDESRCVCRFSGGEIPWDQPQLLCAKCHGPVYRDWQHGSHGRTNGYWDASRGKQTRRKCIECHDPHRPPFPALQPAPVLTRCVWGRTEQADHAGAHNPLQAGRAKRTHRGLGSLERRTLSDARSARLRPIAAALEPRNRRELRDAVSCPKVLPHWPVERRLPQPFRRCAISIVGTSPASPSFFRSTTRR